MIQMYNHTAVTGHAVQPLDPKVWCYHADRVHYCKDIKGAGIRRWQTYYLRMRTCAYHQTLPRPCPPLSPFDTILLCSHPVQMFPQCLVVAGWLTSIFQPVKQTTTSISKGSLLETWPNSEKLCKRGTVKQQEFSYCLDGWLWLKKVKLKVPYTTAA